MSSGLLRGPREAPLIVDDIVLDENLVDLYQLGRFQNLVMRLSLCVKAAIFVLLLDKTFIFSC